VHAVVLFFDIVEMFGVLVDSKRTKYVLKKQESVVILVLNARSIIENSDIGVVHLIITNEHKSGYIDVFI